MTIEYAGAREDGVAADSADERAPGFLFLLLFKQPMNRREGPGFFRFQVDGRFYLYDTSTNALIEIDEPVYFLLQDYLGGHAGEQERSKVSGFTAEQIEGAAAFIEEARKKVGMFQPFFQIDYSSFLDGDYVEMQLRSKLSRLILNLTDKCNQRCTYCVYSGQYLGERTHSDAAMSWEVAKESMDYFLSHSRDTKRKSVSFYGGEPFLAQNLLRKSVQYLRRIPIEGELVIQVSTNLTALHRRLLDFLIEHDVGLGVSLDGPAHIHDRARVFSGGNGTHDVVLRKLAEIEHRAPDYFRKRVLLNCTIDKNRDLLEVYRFFCHEPFRRISVTVNSIRTRETSSYHVTQDGLRRYRAQLEEIVRDHIERIERREPVAFQFIAGLFRDVFQNLARRQLGVGPAARMPNGVCIPGQSRLYVSSNGTFHTCERFSPDGYDIGDYRSGVDPTKVRRQLETAAAMAGELCQQCWAYRLCSHCFLHMTDGGELRKEQKQRMCSVERDGLASSFRRFIRIWQAEERAGLISEESLHGAVLVEDTPD